MPKRLAITIAGAVSLGSYEAGVLYEVIAAIAAHNRATPDVREQIVIDVLTGASAGGMTAAIAAQKLMFDAEALDGAAGNALYMPWVADVDIVPLLAMGEDEPADGSLLSSSFVETLSRRYLTARYSTAPRTPPVRHVASAAALRLGLSLSNLDGVHYRLATRPTGSFVYTRFQDDVRFRVDGPADDRLDLWEPVRAAAVACGAFPFAFRVQELVRRPGEFPQENLVPPGAGDSASFAYTDGGVFQNEPLGIAREFVNELDHHEGEDSRFYLFVSPGGRGFGAPQQFTAREATFVRTASRLLAAVFEQAQFHDWILSESVNDRVDAFDGVALRLHGALLGRQLAPEALAPLTSALLPLLRPRPAPGGADPVAAARTRLHSQFRVEFDQLQRALPAVGAAPDAADLWLDAVMILESLAALDDKDHMRIYAVTATHVELAGTGLHAFQGFFDRAYRQHDYDVGRRKARELVAAINANGDPLGPIRYAPAGAAPIAVDGSLDGLTLDKVDPDRRRELRKRIHDRLHDIMKEAGANALVREGIDLFYLNKLLDEMFGL